MPSPVIIGRILATEKAPTTIDNFAFWTNPSLILNPFDIVKVEHVNGSFSYGMIKDSPKNSPILHQILDVAERGRSLGVVLFAAEQFRSAIHDRVTGNCSTHAYGRTNTIEVTKSDYKSVPPVYKTMMTRLKQGEYIVQNPIFRSMLHIKFPKPIYKQVK